MYLIQRRASILGQSAAVEFLKAQIGDNLLGRWFGMNLFAIQRNAWLESGLRRDAIRRLVTDLSFQKLHSADLALKSTRVFGLNT